MNLKQAHYIRTIAQEGSITGAAKKLYVSQPSLSQMLKQVEGELGLALFDRSVSPFCLTYAGEKYLQAAEVILAVHERLENQMQEIREENSGRLRLGISVQRAMQVLPLALPWFAAQFPHVTLELIERGSADLEELVVQGKVDLALAAIESTSPRLAYELIEEEVIGILAGKHAGLASKYPNGTPISLDMAGEETFVCLKKGHSIRIVQDDLFRRCGLEPNILLETDSLEVARRVALGTGSCMLCSNIYADDLVRRQGVFYPLRGHENPRHFYACYPKDADLPHYARELIQIVTRVLRQASLGA
ncbi:LysR family transcriptional regulator [Pseudoflavonifractor sp. 60]|uniref:LysR substrate-binding domain-containing protein n=1 Tax=Pseudoflavonifractor sp. 60 TaxID=2304576 RepID=UPI001371B94A